MTSPVLLHYAEDSVTSPFIVQSVSYYLSPRREQALDIQRSRIAFAAVKLVMHGLLDYSYSRPTRSWSLLDV